MNKQAVVSLMLQPPRILIDGQTAPLNVPEGCIGFCLAFESAEDSEKWYGKKVNLVNIERIPENENQMDI